MKDHILKNSISVKCPEQASRLVAWGWWWEWGFGGTGESLLMTTEFLVCFCFALWDLSSLPRDGTHGPCSGSMES